MTSCVTARKSYDKALTEAHEQELKVALKQIRASIAEYRKDYGVTPMALNDLISLRYINQLSDDPMTGKKDWVVTWSDCAPTPKCIKRGQDIHSAATGKATSIRIGKVPHYSGEGS
jgi:hypothetical protein